MLISFGRHQGYSTDWLVLNEPGYVWWMLDSRGTIGNFLDVCAEASRLLWHIDAKPFLVTCSGDQCSNLAMRVSAYDGVAQLKPWCDSCDPSIAGVSPGTLTIIRTCREAMSYIARTTSRRSDHRAIIRYLAQAKGLPVDADVYERRAFFATSATASSS
jgi:hypothetical protein